MIPEKSEMKQNCVAVIPARGGSKRIPRKNIKNFMGKPMIAYSIEAAQKSGCFDKIIISTDDSEIASVAEGCGAEVPFIRPEELADDFAGTTPVIKHALEWLDANQKTYEYVCCIYATAPFIQPQFLTEAFEKLISTGAEYCFPVTSYPSPIQRSLKINSQQRLEMFYPENFTKRSQDLEEAYHDAGQFYWGKSEAFKALKPLFSEIAVPFILPRYLVHDIDTPEDWERAEKMWKVLRDK